MADKRMAEFSLPIPLILIRPPVSEQLLRRIAQVLLQLPNAFRQGCDLLGETFLFTTIVAGSAACPSCIRPLRPASCCWLTSTPWLRNSRLPNKYLPSCDTVSSARAGHPKVNLSRGLRRSSPVCLEPVFLNRYPQSTELLLLHL
jgi:hypothetical protein